MEPLYDSVFVHFYTKNISQGAPVLNLFDGSSLTFADTQTFIAKRAQKLQFPCDTSRNPVNYFDLDLPSDLLIPWFEVT